MRKASFYLNNLSTIEGKCNTTNTNGSVAASYEYDAFGNFILAPTNSDANTYLFTTKEFESRSGLYYFGERYYDPEVGRWLTPDPAGMVDGTNLYVYLNNNPLNFVDPWGLSGEKAGSNWDFSDFLNWLDDFSTAMMMNPVADGMPQVPLDQGVGIIGLGVVNLGREGRVFWSGGKKAMNAAINYARANGLETLEMTKAGQKLLSAAKATRNGWIYASKRFAQGTEGAVHVFRKDVVNPESIWKTFEEPILRSSSKVKEIIEHIIKRE